ncbi:MAG: DedA family protein [Actinomycetes bacterium]
MNPLQWDAPYLVVVGALFVIVMLRANATYWIGQLIERGARRTRFSRLMGSPGYARAVDQLNQWGPPVVTLSFLTVGFQTLVNLAAGATRMPLARYLPAVTLGSVMWAFLYGTVGYAGFEALTLLWERSPALAVALAAVAVAALAVFVVWRVRRARRRPPVGADAAASE